MGGFSRDLGKGYLSISLDNKPGLDCLCFFGSLLCGDFLLRSRCRGDKGPKEDDWSDESLLYQEDSCVVGGESRGELEYHAL